MTKAKPNPSLPEIFIEYGAASAAFKRARAKLANQKQWVFIDAEKYDEKAYELLHDRLKQRSASKKQVAEQIEAIKVAANALALAFANASTPTQDLLNRQFREPQGIKPSRYDFDSGMIANMHTCIAAFRAMENFDTEINLAAVKSHGPGKHSPIVGEIADMLAADYFKLTDRPPARTNVDEGVTQKLAGEFIEFFREIFEAAVPCAGVEDAARKSIERWNLERTAPSTKRGRRNARAVMEE